MYYKYNTVICCHLSFLYIFLKSPYCLKDKFTYNLGDFQGFPQRWPIIGIALSSLGFCIGPLLDGIHSNAQLLVYDTGAINIGPLQTNVLVPPFLGVFYGVVGLLQLVLDNRFAAKDRLPKTSSKRLLLSFIFLIVILELSAEMYKAGTPYNREAYVLFALAELNWYLFDGTWWGFGLAALVGVGCPLAEIPLMKDKIVVKVDSYDRFLCADCYTSRVRSDFASLINQEVRKQVYGMRPYNVCGGWQNSFQLLLGIAIWKLSFSQMRGYFDLWHYPKANVAIFDEGLVTWVLACYFSYVPFLANLSRWLDLQLKTQKYDSLTD
ncbi:hypothetical protein L7F22_013704 [Adiantum nelumboides]|nr:hypothetical protein [Adiantum nelumboides]